MCENIKNVYKFVVFSFQLQQIEEAELQQREANLAALAAIGPRRKRPLDQTDSQVGAQSFVFYPFVVWMDHFRIIFSNLICVNVQPAAVNLLPSSAQPAACIRLLV